MPKIAEIMDCQGAPNYSNWGSCITRHKCTGWYISDRFVPTSIADVSYVKKCASKQAAINWALSKSRIKEYGENAEFYITHV